MDTKPTVYSLILREKFVEHGDIWSLRFEPEAPVAFEPGQYVHLKILDETVEKTVRHMSLASAPGDPLLQFTMHVRDESPFKSIIAGLEAGDRAAFFKVKGEFVLPETDSMPVVLIANGVGVTPYRAMLRQLSQQCRALPVTLIHVDRGPHLFEDELRAFDAEQLRVGRDDLDALLVRTIAEQPGALYYAAGATSFIMAVQARLVELGVAPESIKLDDFKAYDELG